jgi:hypothetical protein
MQIHIIKECNFVVLNGTQRVDIMTGHIISTIYFIKLIILYYPINYQIYIL